MKSPVWRVTALLALTVVTMTLVVSDAAAGRRSGMAGLFQIPDRDDVISNPQLLPMYTNTVSLDMSPSSGSENALVIYDLWGGSWMVAANRGEYLNSVAWAYGSGSDRFGGYLLGSDLDTHIGNVVEPVDMQFTHFGFGKPTQNGSWGFSVGIGLDKQGTENTDGEQNTESATIFSLNGGLTSGNLDVAGEVAFGSSADKTETVDPNTEFNGSIFELALGARHQNFEIFEHNFTSTAAFVFGSSTLDVGGTDPLEEEKRTVLAFTAKTGPTWNVTDELTAGVYCGFEFMTDKFETTDLAVDPNVLTEITNTDIVLPALCGATEYWFNEHFAVRMGFRSEYTWEGGETKVGDTTNKTTDRMYNYFWTAGASYQRGRVTIDGAFNEDWLYTGGLWGSDSEDMLGHLQVTIDLGGAN